MVRWENAPVLGYSGYKILFTQNLLKRNQKSHVFGTKFSRLLSQKYTSTYISYMHGFKITDQICVSHGLTLFAREHGKKGLRRRKRYSTQLVI